MQKFFNEALNNLDKIDQKFIEDYFDLNYKINSNENNNPLNFFTDPRAQILINQNPSLNNIFKKQLILGKELYNDRDDLVKKIDIILESIDKTSPYQPFTPTESDLNNLAYYDNYIKSSIEDDSSYFDIFTKPFVAVYEYLF